MLVPFYAITDHPTLPNWFIRVSSIDQEMLGAPTDRHEKARLTQYDLLLRLAMNQRMRQAAQNLGIDLVVPDEYAVPYQDPGDGDVSRRYFVISQKLESDLCEREETIVLMKTMDGEKQIKLAQNICRLIKTIGLANATFDNIRLMRDGRLAIIDTQPIGLLVASGDLLRAKGHSVEKCARIGLYSFATSAKRYHGLDLIAGVAQEHYQQSLKEVSWTKIAFSILCPLIPLVFLIIALVKTTYIRQIITRRATQKFLLETPGLVAANERPEAQQKELINRYLAEIEDVPFDTQTN